MITQMKIGKPRHEMAGHFSDNTEKKSKSPDMKWWAIFLIIQIKI